MDRLPALVLAASLARVAEADHHPRAPRAQALPLARARARAMIEIGVGHPPGIMVIQTHHRQVQVVASLESLVEDHPRVQREVVALAAAMIM